MPRLSSWSIVLASAVLVFSVSCTATPEPTSTLIPIKRFSSKPTSPPVASGLSNSEIVSAFKQNPGVLDAAVSQRGDNISLVVIVGPLMSKSRAQQLGDNFVRLYKSLSDDDPPGQSIGRGKYSYSIGVYTPDERPIAVGAKASVANSISW